MDTIAHRELRNSSSEILGRVAAGESIAVTNHGVVAAILIPPASTEVERQRRAGSLRQPRRGGRGFGGIARARVDGGTDEVLADLRGDR